MVILFSYPICKKYNLTVNIAFILSISYLSIIFCNYAAYALSPYSMIMKICLTCEEWIISSKKCVFNRILYINNYAPSYLYLNINILIFCFLSSLYCIVNYISKQYSHIYFIYIFHMPYNHAFEFYIIHFTSITLIIKYIVHKAVIAIS